MTKSELELFTACANNPFLFATHCKIVHPIKGKVTFNLYPFQKRVLYDFIANRFNVVLKPRQMGITELIAMYVLWLTLFHFHKNVQIISLKDRVAKRVLRRIKFMYKNLPECLKVPIVNGHPNEYGTGSEMLFENYSSIMSIPTTEDAGRSEAASLLIMDEAAIMKGAEVIWAAAFPSLATGGAAIINSTPYGVGGFFHALWTDALYGVNPFNNVKLHWTMHPERDEAWYRLMRNTLGAKRTAQEVDCDFLTSGDNVFDLLDIKDIEESLSDYPILEAKMNGTFLVFLKAKPNEQYFIGSDISTGRAADYSSFTVFNKSGEEMACFKGRIPVNRLANLLAQVGMDYNNALIAVDAIGVGEAVISKLQELSYPNLYYTERVVKEHNKKKPEIQKFPGFYLHTNNRGIIITLLEEDIREGAVIIKDPFFVSEAYTFIYDSMNRPVAMSKGEYIGEGDETYADDAILGKAIANFIRRGKSLPTDNTPPR